MQQGHSDEIYVDKMLKSSRGIDEAVDLIQRIRNICKARGFMLTKFVMYTCLASRAVHIEFSHSMTTDSFIQALRRLIARRGNKRQIRSDNGPDLVGAE